MSDETRYVPGPNGGLVGIMPDYQNADRAAGVLGGQYLGLKPGNPPTLLSELQQRRLSKAKFLEGMKAAEQELADIDRAIAALTLAPVEAGIPEGLGEVDTRPMGKWTPVLEFMSRPGAVKWEIGKSLEPPPGVPLEVLFDNGAVELGTKETFNDEYDEAKGFIRAYRIISEPAAGEGDGAETRAMTNPHSTLAAAPAGFTEFTLETVLSYDWKDRFEIIRRDGRREVLLGDDCTWGFNEQPEPDDILFFRNIGPSAAAPDITPDAEINSGPFENDAEPASEPSDYFPTQPFTIGASKPHADESDAQMFAAGINRELVKA